MYMYEPLQRCDCYTRNHVHGKKLTTHDDD